MFQSYVKFLMMLFAASATLIFAVFPSQAQVNRGDEEDDTVFAEQRDPSAYHPLKKARDSYKRIVNYEATVPPQCYTKTEGKFNPCYACHTDPVLPNELTDWELQEEYAFSDFATTNRWNNLFEDRSERIAKISDAEALAYVRQSNWRQLAEYLANDESYKGYVPDLDFDKGFEVNGFAKDGSQWRAIRYKPFLGTFWPTNGNTDDVFIRLPKKFRTKDGIENREIYKTNLAILEAVIAAGPLAGEGDKFRFPIEPIDEIQVGLDLDKNGTLGIAAQIVGWPKTYAADAKDIETVRYIYPKNTEFLHSVRYLDPDATGMIAARMKELRYSKKLFFYDTWAIQWRYEMEYNEKELGELPYFKGGPTTGILNGYGWILQGFIEDGQGRLRAQTHEEHQFCMGCHSAVGVSVDHTFTLARKVPGAEGWRYQDPNGIPDAPQQGHEKGEIATYFERVGGGDEFRANTEVLERFFEGHTPIESEVARASVDGDRDISYLITPSRKRALTLNKAYMSLVREQNFEYGRDTIVGPIENVFTKIENGTTALAPEGKIYRDSMLWLDWNGYLDKMTKRKLTKKTTDP